MFVTACSGTATRYSNSFVKPTQTIKELKVLYLENKLVAERGASGTVSLTKIGYNDLPELLRERVPIVFNANGISTDYATIQRRNFGQKEAIESVEWAKNGNAGASLLIIQVVDGSALTDKYGTTYYLNLDANLFDANTRTRLWTGQFQNTVQYQAFNWSRFDNAFVDKMLTSILEQMAKEGYVTIKAPKSPPQRRQEVR